MDASTNTIDNDLSKEIAGEFPGTAQGTYLSACTRGLLPASARTALDAHLEDLTNGRTNKAGLFTMQEDVRKRFADLIGAQSEEIAFTKNVSDGLNMIAASIAMEPGDNVVVTLSLEHPNNVYPWLNQRARRGVNVKTIPHNNGHIDIDAMIAAIDERTKVVTLPTVSFSPGFRSDAKRLGKVCRERGVFLLVDAVQSVGVLHTDVKDMLVDGLATSTQKGMCGLYGMGFLYCRTEWATRIEPAYLARFSVDLGPDAHEATMGDDNYGLLPDARRFDLGNYNFPATTVAQQSLIVLSNVGTQRIEQHVMNLSHRFIDGLLEYDLPVSGGAFGAHSSHIVSIGNMTNSQSSTDDDALMSFSEHLTQADVIHTVRRGMLRFAFHVYNSMDDVDHVLALTKEWRASNAT